MKRMATLEMKQVSKGRIGSLNRLATLLAHVVSILLGEQVSIAQSLHLLNALVAGTCAVLFGGFSLLAQLLFLVWLFIAIWQYRKA